MAKESLDARIGKTAISCVEIVEGILEDRLGLPTRSVVHSQNSDDNSLITFSINIDMPLEAKLFYCAVNIGTSELFTRFYFHRATDAKIFVKNYNSGRKKQRIKVNRIADKYYGGVNFVDVPSHFNPAKGPESYFGGRVFESILEKYFSNYHVFE